MSGVFRGRDYGTNFYLENNKAKATKSIISGLHGRIFLLCKVTSVKNGTTFVTYETGENSGNMSFYDRIKEGAKQNAMMKHISNGGVSGSKVYVYDYYIKYFDVGAINKRVRIRGKYRVLTFYNGKIVNNSAWKTRRYNEDIFDEKQDFISRYR